MGETKQARKERRQKIVADSGEEIQSYLLCAILVFCHNFTIKMIIIVCRAYCIQMSCGCGQLAAGGRVPFKKEVVVTRVVEDRVVVTTSLALTT